MARALLHAVVLAAIALLPGNSAAMAGSSLALPPTPAVAAPPVLTGADLDTYLDGLIPFALARGDMAGAEVIVVKDGRILFAKGYGYADIAAQRRVDPIRTRFRAGSISKLFTWTAVMQLAEQGKLDLDADVNRYLDFTIPPRFGKPVTMRTLMTHTAGFEEVYKGIVVSGRDSVPTLDEFVKKWVPTRIYPPGTVIAYSNYGATLAGYIVQRVSGQKFEDYVRDHIFRPLHMDHSTFLQNPHPGDHRATGYVRASEGPRGFEFVGDAPAGALSTTGGDMGRFMLAYLNGGQLDGAAILRPATVQAMFRPAFTPAPHMNSMLLGFYGENMNGQRIVGHAGDLITFHADLHLMPDAGIGLYIAMNSWGKDNASTVFREALFRGFVDRYFPARLKSLPPVASAASDGRKLVGQYESSRRSVDSFASLATLMGQGRITQYPDHTLSFSRFLGANGAPKHWREIGPMLWREVGGEALLSAIVKNGRVAAIATTDEPPVLVWTPAPIARSAAWNLPLLGLTLAILVGAVLIAAAAPVVRRAYGVTRSLTGRRAWVSRLARLAALSNLLFLAGWLAVFVAASEDTAILSASLDPWLRALQAVGVAAIVLDAFAFMNGVYLWRERPRRRWAVAGSLALNVACLSTLWFIFAFHLITIGLEY